MSARLMDASVSTSMSTPLAPAPWQLQGRGYIALLRFDDGGQEQDRFVPESLRGKRGPSRYAWLMFVDYQHSDVGPYHELLFIPGRFAFEDGRRHLSISRIFVSTQASVDNGRRNWGIPKELAAFEVDYGADGVDRVRLSRDGRCFATLAFRARGPRLPFPGHWLPDGLRTLGQHHQGQCFIYTPSARGALRLARVEQAWSDPAEFPALQQARVISAVAVPRFAMGFPVSRQLPLPA